MSNSWVQPRSDSPTDSPRVVGLGASAGGLQALQGFLAHVPPDSGLAYVVVQHLDPNHKAALTELLARVAPIPVLEATDTTRIVADTVYVIAPNSELTLAGGMLQASVPTRPHVGRRPIDTLFNSLAQDQAERAVGVVLSGMGSDGTLGLQAIRARGGATFAQTPESADFDSMPRSAISAGAVGQVALAQDLPALILKAVAGSGAGAPPPAAAAESSGTLGAILAMLRQRSHHDLSQYKPSTLRRRVERRMGVHGLASMAEYEQFLHLNPGELDWLFKEMLIGVTRFFRDPEVWKEVADTVLPALMAQADPAQPMRAWVAGCSSGEEAYTLAMVFEEARQRHPATQALRLQIFATDLSADAIAAARRGEFAARVREDLSADRLERFFVRHERGYRVRAEIRQMVLFAQHDVLQDPPFTRLDLLCCRNLLIYFSAALQRRLVPLFHYSLRPGGILVLGESESLGRPTPLFEALDLSRRIYRRQNHLDVVNDVDFPVHRIARRRANAQDMTVSEPSTPPLNLQALADQVVLQTFAPASVLVNEQGDILYINGRTGRYLEPAAGKANWNIHVMARPGLRFPLSTALRQSLQQSGPVVLSGLPLEGEMPPATVDITVQALREPKGLQGTAMIVFRDVARAHRPRRKRAAGTPDAAEQELLAGARAENQALRVEMRASEQALQAANEDLQSVNEELQSANEELTTSKEESQSMNEELQTINAELQSKLDDLALAQSDMQNVLNSTQIATLFLDSDLNVRRYTDRISQIVHLREADIGRPLSELASTLIYPELLDDAQRVLRALAFVEKQIQTTDGHWYSVRIMPYRTLTDVIAGVVITFVDISALKTLESQLHKS